jgi:hypothetical protein
MTAQNEKLLAVMPDRSGNYKNLENGNKQAYVTIDILSYSVS